MNNTIIWRPYRHQAWVLLFTMPICILYFVFTGYGITDLGLKVLFFAVPGIVCVLFTKCIYDTSNIAVIFEQDGFRIVERNYRDYRYVSWKEFSFAYYARNFKGHLFLVLSPKKLSSEEVKQLAKRSANSIKISVNEAVVFPVDFLKDSSSVKTLIDSHVINLIEDKK